MLTAIIFIYMAFVIWKLTPVVFRAIEIRKQFKADVEIRRLDMRKKQTEEEAEAVKKANDEYKEHTKRVVESVGHGGRVQYPWVSGVKTNLDSEINKEFINMRGELAKKDHEAQRGRGIRTVPHLPTAKDLIDKTSSADIQKTALKNALKKLYEEEGP